jgi:hypothetical protein
MGPNPCTFAHTKSLQNLQAMCGWTFDKYYIIYIQRTMSWWLPIILEREGDQNKVICCYAWVQRVGMAWAHSRLLYMEAVFFACD